jgi:hypothetical protein
VWVLWTEDDETGHGLVDDIVAGSGGDMDSGELAGAAFCPEASFDFGSDFVAVSAEKAACFISGGAGDVLVDVEPVPLPIYVQVRRLGAQPGERIGDRAGAFTGEN